MTSLKTLAGIAFSVLLFAPGAVNAKGPGRGSSPAHTPGGPQGQGVHGPSWTSPPGWSQGDKSGWSSGATVPPGFDNGGKTGWGTTTTTLPPGIQKRQH